MENMIYTYNEIFCLKREENTTTCDNMDGPGRHYAKT
jgi:hypothetical protein